MEAALISIVSNEIYFPQHALIKIGTAIVWAIWHLSYHMAYA